MGTDIHHPDPFWVTACYPGTGNAVTRELPTASSSGPTPAAENGLVEHALLGKSASRDRERGIWSLSHLHLMRDTLTSSSPDGLSLGQACVAVLLPLSVLHLLASSHIDWSPINILPSKPHPSVCSQRTHSATSADIAQTHVQIEKTHFSFLECATWAQVFL